MSVREYMTKTSVQSFMAIFIMVFCLFSLVFINLNEVVQSFLCSLLLIVANYYFRNSTTKPDNH